MNNPTYREKIQDLIKRMDEIYDECEGLRDFASNYEKFAWNYTRGIFHSDAQKGLRKLDNMLSQERANQSSEYFSPIKSKS